MDKRILLVEKAIDVSSLSDWVWSPASGATVQFLGRVRDINEGKKVTHIEYSAHELLALKEMHKMVDEVFAQWNILKCALVHRVGMLSVGDVAVAILVSSLHRKEAFLSSQYLIDTLKERVPIWKKEFYHAPS